MTPEMAAWEEDWLYGVEDETRKENDDDEPYGRKVLGVLGGAFLRLDGGSGLVGEIGFYGRARDIEIRWHCEGGNSLWR